MNNIASKFISTILVFVAICPTHAQTKEPLVFENNNGEIVRAQYDEDDNLFITASVNGIINLWDPETGLLIRTFGVAAKPSKNADAELSPDGKLLAWIGGRGGKVWSTKFGDIVCPLTGFGDSIKSLHFSSDSKWLITSSMDGTAKLWDVMKGHRQSSLYHAMRYSIKKEQIFGVTDARFCDDDHSIVTGTGRVIEDSVRSALDSSRQVLRRRYDSAALVWDIKTGKVAHTLLGYPFDVSPDGERIVCGSINTAGNTVRVWNASTGDLVYSLSGHKGPVTTVQFSRDGKWILTASAKGGTCRLWEASSGKATCYLDAVTDNISNAVQFSPDSKLISTFSRDTAKIWEIATGRLIHKKPAGHPVTFSHNSRYFIVLNDNRATICETVSGKPVMVEKKPAKGSKKVLRVD